MNHACGILSTSYNRKILICLLLAHRDDYYGKILKKLVELSISFAVEILNLVNKLKQNKESIICNQIGRSGTSIGANIHEAQYAQSKLDFMSKLQIALKEAAETQYWLELLRDTGIVESDPDFVSLCEDCTELIKLLTSSVNTVKTK